MNTTERPTSTTKIKVPKELGISEDWTIMVPNTYSGAPKPLIGFDYDGTLVDSAETYCEAAKQIVMMYTDDLSRIPTLEQFQHGVFPDFHSWGVPRKVPIDDAWSIFQSLVTKIEQRKPSAFFDGVVTQIREIATRFHIVIVTLNSIHPVSRVVKDATGVDVDTLVVEDKTAVLSHLACQHGYHYNREILPFYYFGDSVGDMRASNATCGLVYPVAVTRKARLSCAHERRIFSERMRSYGARAIVSHSRMLDVVNGVIKVDGAILI